MSLLIVLYVPSQESPRHRFEIRLSEIAGTGGKSSLRRGFLRFFDSAGLHESGSVREVIFAELLPREETHVGAETGFDVLIKIDKAINIRGKSVIYTPQVRGRLVALFSQTKHQMAIEKRRGRPTERPRL